MATTKRQVFILTGIVDTKTPHIPESGKAIPTAAFGTSAKAVAAGKEYLALAGSGKAIRFENPDSETTNLEKYAKSHCELWGNADFYGFDSGTYFSDRIKAVYAFADRVAEWLKDIESWSV